MRKFRGTKIGFSGLCLMALVFALLGCSSPAASEPNDFRGIKWGAEVASLSGFTPIAQEGDLAFYEKEGDALQFESVKLDQVIYGFYKGRLYTVMVYFPAAGMGRMKDILSRQSGEPSNPDNASAKLLWDGPNVSVLLSPGGGPDSARLVYLYKPIQLEVELKK